LLKQGKIIKKKRSEDKRGSPEGSQGINNSYNCHQGKKNSVNIRVMDDFNFSEE